MFSSICVLLLMLTTYCLFPTAAGNRETCPGRAESHPRCPTSAWQPGHGSVRTFVLPKPGAPIRVEHGPSKRTNKYQGALPNWRRPDKWRAGMDGQTLILPNGKQIALKGGGTSDTPSHHLHSQDFSSFWTNRAGKDGREPLPLSCPRFRTISWRRGPSSSPWHWPGDPPWTQLGLITSVFPGSQGFVVETLPEGPKLWLLFPNICGKAAEHLLRPQAAGKPKTRDALS